MEEKDKQQRLFGVQRFKRAECPGSILVGSCYLKGPVRFNSLNEIDTATVRCGLYPSPSKSGQAILDGVWAIWSRMRNTNSHPS